MSLVRDTETLACERVTTAYARVSGLRKRNPVLPSTKADVSPEKAKKILKDGHVNGHPLTEKQRGMFGAIAGNETEPTKNSAPPRRTPTTNLIPVGTPVKNSALGSTAGSLAGGEAGAAIGSAIAPGVGTVIGGALGSMAGGALGDKAI